MKWLNGVYYNGERETVLEKMLERAARCGCGGSVARAGLLPIIGYYRLRSASM